MRHYQLILIFGVRISFILKSVCNFWGKTKVNEIKMKIIVINPSLQITRIYVQKRRITILLLLTSFTFGLISSFLLLSQGICVKVNVTVLAGISTRHANCTYHADNHNAMHASACN